MGLFDFLKSKGDVNTSEIVNAIGCDVHSHFIPGIDDGAKTLADSINLIKQFSDLGYKKIITTPHIMSDFYKNTPEIILSGLEKLREEIKKQNIPIEINAAAEYYLDYEFEEKLDVGKVLTFGQNYVLFEISYMNPPENIEEVIFKIQTQGYIPVLAHPERYNYLHHQFNIYEEIIEKGALLQLNLNSLTGYYSNATKKIAQQLIEKNMISFVGSDCHHDGHVNLMKKALAESHMKQLIESGKLLNNTL